MSTKLYVGGLSYGTTDESLNSYFSQAGSVASAQIMMDKMTNRSRGFGFVEMGSDEEAQNAISMFDGKEFEGRTLKVNEARPMTDRPMNSRGPRRDGGFSPRGRERRF